MHRYSQVSYGAKDDDNEPNTKFTCTKSICSTIIGVFCLCLCIVAVLGYTIDAVNTTSESHTNTSATVTAKRLLDWWKPDTMETSIIRLNDTDTIPVPSIPPPTCCWPDVETKTNSCRRLNIHSVYCATKRHPKCTAGIASFTHCREPMYESHGFTCKPSICCKAVTAPCMSCIDGVPKEVFCACKPKTSGCESYPD